MGKWLGIDGGGSTLRLALVDDAMRVQQQVERGAANPNSVGREEAARRIQAAVREALNAVVMHDLSGVGIGVAGAADGHAEQWLRDTLRPVLPDVPVVPSSDMEIALVGARGRLDGVVLVAGTGSVAYGVAADGRSLRAGGWGYVLGDEGSGYWIGLQALKTMTRFADGRQQYSRPFVERMLAALNVQHPSDVIHWLYPDVQPRRVAELATQVLAAAAEGDPTAQEILQQAADELAALARYVLDALEMPLSSLVFAGGLLSSDHALMASLLQRLSLNERPPTRYPPVIGAALLAKLRLE